MISKTRQLPELLLGLGIIFIGLIIAQEAFFMRPGPVYAKLGPAGVPSVVAGLLIICGALVALYPRQTSADDEAKAQLSGPASIVAGLLLQVFLLERIGFIPSATLLFFLTAHGFGSRNYFRDAAIAVALAGISFAVFRYGLGLRLPLGNWFT
ncbi:MAG TPA: tripartite tricarboxylate transporter TctB family protein [Aestuariivirga sp.]|nr:tripartite tricarboxylate transporter TctB family protein [Aestuariivirga sp.]